jgi:hypothetical protein
MDPYQTQHFSAAFAGMMGIIIFVGLLFAGFMVFLFWRIFVKAGMAGPLSLLILLWPIGLFINLCILAFGEWKVVPVAAAPPYYPPSYPPAPQIQR